ncbi:MAG: hypothetical protein ACI8W7_004486 [Gammaproteobacteria bacterium]|jgi:hypothetical protein
MGSSLHSRRHRAVNVRVDVREKCGRNARRTDILGQDEL